MFDNLKEQRNWQPLEVRNLCRCLVNKKYVSADAILHFINGTGT